MRDLASHVAMALLLAGVACVLPGCGEPPKPTDEAAASDVKLEVVTYEQLEAAIKKHAGKVVVLDVWADFCVPCKREFPNLVNLHKRYARDGVVCVSVSVDKVAKKAAALEFLRSKGAAFTNYLVDGGGELWDRWDFKGVPAVFVFDQQGKRVGNFTGDDPDKQFTYPDVEKLVQKLISGSR